MSKTSCTWAAKDRNGYIALMDSAQNYKGWVCERPDGSWKWWHTGGDHDVSATLDGAKAEVERRAGL